MLDLKAMPIEFHPNLPLTTIPEFIFCMPCNKLTKEWKKNTLSCYFPSALPWCRGRESG